MVGSRKARHGDCVPGNQVVEGFPLLDHVRRMLKWIISFFFSFTTIDGIVITITTVISNISFGNGRCIRCNYLLALESGDVVATKERGGENLPCAFKSS